MSTNTLNNTTNQLLLKYDDNFNKLYNSSDVLNQGIMNKEELIYKNLEANEQKDKMIDALYYTIAFVTMASILFILNALGKLPQKTLMILLLILFLIYIFIIYYIIIYDQKKSIAILSAQTGLGMKSWLESLFTGGAAPYKCPGGCINDESGMDDISGDDDYSGLEPEDPNKVTAYPTVILDKQSSENVWLNGDKSMNLYNAKFINPGILRKGNYYSQEELNTIQPQPWFRSINPNGATYYQCEFDGAYPKLTAGAKNMNKGNGIPMIGKESVFSTIPCGEMAGYTQTGRYICNTDRELKRLDRAKCSKVEETDYEVEINLS